MRDRLKALREIAGVSQSELARLSRLARQHVQAIECGTIASPRLKVAAALADTLGCSLDYLSDGIGVPPSLRKVRAAVAAAKQRIEDPDASRRVA